MTSYFLFLFLILLVLPSLTTSSISGHQHHHKHICMSKTDVENKFRAMSDLIHAARTKGVCQGRGNYHIDTTLDLDQ